MTQLHLPGGQTTWEVPPRHSEGAEAGKGPAAELPKAGHREAARHRDAPGERAQANWGVPTAQYFPQISPVSFRFHTVKVSILPKSTYRCNMIHIKTTGGYFIDMDKSTLKCISKSKEKMTKVILKKNKIRGFTQLIPRHVIKLQYSPQCGMSKRISP